MTHQVESSTRDMNVTMQFGNMAFSLNAEGVSWSPDVASDMTTRVLGMFRETLAEAAAYGLLPSSADELELITEDGDDDGE